MEEEGGGVGVAPGDGVHDATTERACVRASVCMRRKEVGGG